LKISDCGTYASRCWPTTVYANIYAIVLAAIKI
jgi:hypothetical protein